jgi:hypothetical protein
MGIGLWAFWAWAAFVGVVLIAGWQNPFLDLALVASFLGVMGLLDR